MILTDTKRIFGPRDRPKNSANTKYRETISSDQSKTAAINSILGMVKNMIISVLSRTASAIKLMAKICVIFVYPSGQEHLEKIAKKLTIRLNGNMNEFPSRLIRSRRVSSIISCSKSNTIYKYSDWVKNCRESRVI